MAEITVVFNGKFLYANYQRSFKSIPKDYTKLEVYYFSLQYKRPVLDLARL